MVIGTLQSSRGLWQHGEVLEPLQLQGLVDKVGLVGPVR